VPSPSGGISLIYLILLSLISGLAQGSVHGMSDGWSLSRWLRLEDECMNTLACRRILISN
jgi:putative effector of murein hydrolase